MHNAVQLTLVRRKQRLLFMAASNHLSLLTAGLRVQESQEGLVVMRTDISEVHPDSDSTLRPPHDSSRTHSGQLGRLTKDQLKLSAKGGAISSDAGRAPTGSRFQYPRRS